MAADLHGLDKRILCRQRFFDAAEHVSGLSFHRVENNSDLAALFCRTLCRGRGEPDGDRVCLGERDCAGFRVQCIAVRMPGDPAAVFTRRCKRQLRLRFDMVYAVVIGRQNALGVAQVDLLAVFFQILGFFFLAELLIDVGLCVLRRGQYTAVIAPAVADVRKEHTQGSLRDKLVCLLLHLRAKLLYKRRLFCIFEDKRANVERDCLFILGQFRFFAALPCVDRVAAVDAVGVDMIAFQTEMILDEAIALHDSLRHRREAVCTSGRDRSFCRILAVVAAGDRAAVHADERAERTARRTGNCTCRVAVRNGRSVFGLADEAADRRIAAARFHLDGTGRVAVFHRAVQVANQTAHVELCFQALHRAADVCSRTAVADYRTCVCASDEAACCAVGVDSVQRTRGEAVFYRTCADVCKQTHVCAFFNRTGNGKVFDHTGSDEVEQTLAARKTGNHEIFAVERTGIFIAGRTDARPCFAVEVDVVGQRRVQSHAAAVDRICEPCELCGAGNLIRSVRALFGLGLRRAVPADTGVGELDGDGLIAGDGDRAALGDIVFLRDGVIIRFALHKGECAVVVCHLRALCCMGHGDSRIYRVCLEGDCCRRHRLKYLDMDVLVLAFHREGDVFDRLIAKLRRRVGVIAVRKRIAAVLVGGHHVALCVLDGDDRTLRAKREGNLRERLGAEVLEFDKDVACIAVDVRLLIGQRQLVARRKIRRERLPRCLVVSLQQRLCSVLDNERTILIARCRAIVGEVQAQRLFCGQGDGRLAVVSHAVTDQIVARSVLDRLVGIDVAVCGDDAVAICEEVFKHGLPRQRDADLSACFRQFKLARRIIALRVRNGVGIRADRKRAGLRRVLCDRLVIDDLAALANHDSVGLFAVLRQGHMERDRRILEFLERRNCDVLRLAARNGKLARRVLATKLRGGVGICTGRQHDGACAVCGLIGRAGFLVGEHKGRSRGSKGEVHLRKLLCFEVLESCIVGAAMRRVFQQQRIACKQINAVAFPLVASVICFYALVVFVDHEAIR